MFDLHTLLKKIMIEPHSLYFWLIEIGVLFLGWFITIPFGLIVNILTRMFNLSSTNKNHGLIIVYSIAYYTLSVIHLHYTGQHFSFLLLMAMIIKEVVFDAKDKNLTPEALKATYASGLALIICLIPIAVKGPFSWY